MQYGAYICTLAALHTLVRVKAQAWVNASLEETFPDKHLRFGSVYEAKVAQITSYIRTLRPLLNL